MKTLTIADRLHIGGRGADLQAHLATHGPLSVPRGDPRWGAAVGRAVATSGLLGRGGAGFPSAAKWEACRRASRRPVVVVNALEGEPASAKDRVLLTCCPHLVLDGAEVVAAVLGASAIIVCVADHSDQVAASVEAAIGDRRRAGIAHCPISVRRPPGRYVAGEESALTDWLSGGPGLPAMRVDKSVPLRLARHGVLVHNVETMSQVALVARHGPEWFRRLGTPDAAGSTLVTVTGGVDGPVVFEVELGTPVAEILERGGVDGPLSAVLLGGYGGAWCEASRLDTPFAPGPLASIGATMGVGAVVAPVRLGVRHGRDRPDRPVPGRGERRPVRSVRVRAPGHRRRSRAARIGPGRSRGARSHRPAGRHRGRAGCMPSPRRAGAPGPERPPGLRRGRAVPCREGVPARATRPRPRCRFRPARWCAGAHRDRAPANRACGFGSIRWPVTPTGTVPSCSPSG